MSGDDASPVRIFMVAGEESGDQLGAALMRALAARLPGDVRFDGVGGRAMEAEGLRSLFPISDITAMGIAGVIAGLPRIVRRGFQVVAAVEAARPDVLVVIDSPDFTHSVARLARRRIPGLPVVNYVSPSVWAWRPGRAKRMRAYVDHVAALKPFEPEVHRRLGGPPCTYVGHPLVETLHLLRPAPGERPPISADPVTLLVLPGSRRSEVSRLMEPFGATIGLLAGAGARPFEAVIPAIPRLADDIRRRAASWPVAPRIVVGDEAKHAAFRRAGAALAASGTVTLELALAGVPATVAYRVSRWEEPLKFLVEVPSIVLANLVLGENAMPEFVGADSDPVRMAEALRPLMSDTPERRRQLTAFSRLDEILETDASETPSQRTASIVMSVLGRAGRP